MMTMTPDSLTNLDPTIADAAVCGILRECRWLILGEGEGHVTKPLTWTDPTWGGIAAEPGWTYLRTECDERGQMALIRGRLAIDVNELGDPELYADWELIGLWDARGVRSPHAGESSGSVGFPTSHTIIQM